MKIFKMSLNFVFIFLICLADAVLQARWAYASQIKVMAEAFKPAEVKTTAELECSAAANSEPIKLVRSASGLILIDDEDPNFDLYDIVINLQNPDKVKIRIAKFIATEKVPLLKKEISTLSPEMQNEILMLAKARVIDHSGGYDRSGDAYFTFHQGPDRLDVYCRKFE